MVDASAMARELGLSPEAPRSRHETLAGYGRMLAAQHGDDPAGGGDEFDALALATTYQDAAVVAFLIDVETARGDLAQAAEWYRRLASPVTGWYREVPPPIADWLDVAGATGGCDHDAAARHATTVIDRMLAGDPGGLAQRPGSAPDPAAPRPASAGQDGGHGLAGGAYASGTARRNPAQDAYAFLTAGLLATRHPGLPDLLERARSTGQAGSAVSVGALGLPLRWFWKAASLLAFDDTADHLLSHLAVAVRLQDEAVREAQRDARRYQRLMAPIDVIDLDIALLASAAALRWDLDESVADDLSLAHRDLDDPRHGQPAGEGRGRGARRAGPALGAVSLRAGLALGAQASPEHDGGPDSPTG